MSGNDTILQIYGGSPKKRGSLEEYFLRLASDLRIQGFRTIFVFNREISPALRDLYDEVGHVMIVPESERRLDPQMVKTFWRLFREIKPALINFHFGRSCPNGLLAARLSGIRNTVWTKHSFYENGPFYRRVPLPNTFLSMICLQAFLARQLIAVSDGVKRELLGYHVPQNKIARIYLGINLARFRRQTGPADFIADLGIPAGKRLVGCVSQARPEKGLEYLLRAMPPVCCLHPDVHLLIVGGGPLTEELRRLAAELRIDEHVTFCGVRNDVEIILSTCEFTVLPSLTEGLPLALIESLACARPVVASNVGGIPEVITDSGEGYLVEPKDVQNLSDRMIRLLASKKHLKAMSAASLEKARLFDVVIGANRTIDLYKNIINQ